VKKSANSVTLVNRRGCNSLLAFVLTAARKWSSSRSPKSKINGTVTIVRENSTKTSSLQISVYLFEVSVFERHGAITMLLTGYTKTFSLPSCMPGSTSLHCVADLNEDISEVLPFINATIGGYAYIKEPPSVSFKMYGKLLSVHARQICVNALKDEEEGENILKWLMKEINDAWENRKTIEPKYEDPPKPTMVQVLKLLPKTNCKECGLPTCMLFATRVMEGLKGADDCPPLTSDQKEAFKQFLSGFVFDV
jgi:ArsR family metal-binding transcriptional regulator